MSHIWMRRVTRINAPCHAYKWVMSHIQSPPRDQHQIWDVRATHFWVCQRAQLPSFVPLVFPYFFLFADARSWAVAHEAPTDIHVYVYVFECVFKFVCKWLLLCMCLYIYMYVNLYVSGCLCVCVCKHIYNWLPLQSAPLFFFLLFRRRPICSCCSRSTYIYMYMCICACKYIFTCTYTHIHTYICVSSCLLSQQLPRCQQQLCSLSKCLPRESAPLVVHL